MMGQTYADGNSYYRRIRDQRPADAVEVAARFIYLNKTCFNGLYRVNKAGNFNVPEGTYTNPNICAPERLRDCSAALQKARIRLGDFKDIVPQKGDVIYGDPPYDGCFDKYQKNGFDMADQKRLLVAASRWSAAGAKVILSNADTRAMRELYRGWTIHDARAPRTIGQRVDSRKKAAELVITNA